MYPQEIVLPLKEELTDNGFTELTTPGEVDAKLKEPGTTLVMINSVCGCSARSARPGVLMAVANSTHKPDHLTTAFAGFDIDAVNKVREQCTAVTQARRRAAWATLDPYVRFGCRRRGPREATAGRCWQ